MIEQQVLQISVVQVATFDGGWLQRVADDDRHGALMQAVGRAQAALE